MFSKLVKKLFHPPFSHLSYAQEGEDMILKVIFEDIETGFYVDVGALHPVRFSSTYHFYMKGWQGINIEAMPGSMQEFNKKRPRDINLELAISDKKEMITYYVFNEPALNGFSRSLSLERNENTSYKILFTKELQTIPISEVLDQYLLGDQTINFLNIDTEGYDYKVLKSNNWEKYRPEIVVIEDYLPFEKIFESEIFNYMQKLDYEIYCRTLRTTIYKQK